MQVKAIARICHQANKALCENLGDYSQYDWGFAENWQKDSVIKGVRFHLNNPHAPASVSHNEWMKEKIDTGWKYGPIKDPDKKEHPCLVDFDKLPPEQQAKDHLFKSIVNALQRFID